LPISKVTANFHEWRMMLSTFGPGTARSC
jgi:hypothetical protein